LYLLCSVPVLSPSSSCALVPVHCNSLIAAWCHAVLKGLTLVLPHGTTTAVVGRSGAGKSTVAALLSRFYAPDSGSAHPLQTYFAH